MTESYDAASGGWDVEEQAFAGAPVVGGGQAVEPGAGDDAVRAHPGDGAGPGPAPEAVVERALTALDGLEELPPAEHVQRYEQVHEALRAHLSGDA
ncbi:hypothetical protein [Myceligenerans pegani]|uniref:Uncharacterized protein n=1 Tax=Myceligenerans pegani TaxID=2776917 RepID=A0ABR9N4B9_9MICO|nr:hypothetical protein [Myceligenerans sp. TRM 65318]MBE1878523.1 hypothetical protein [Myceligenerans sp. TRM 65318]MBE3020794.1 hypothetical protein [Myceligenerans sp. TRM 65318]